MVNVVAGFGVATGIDHRRANRRRHYPPEPVALPERRVSDTSVARQRYDAADRNAGGTTAVARRRDVSRRGTASQRADEPTRDRSVIEARLNSADVARVRFSHSPIRELIASLQVIGDRSRHHVYRGWLNGMGRRLATIRLGRLSRLAELVASEPVATFLTPPPTVAWGVLADELDIIASTSPTVVRATLERLAHRSLPMVLQPLHHDPGTELPLLVQEMCHYWRAVVEPVWERLQALAIADVHHRSAQFATGGVAQVLQHLHPMVSFTGDKLVVDDSRPDHRWLEPRGAGLVLVPCIYGWPGVNVSIAGNDLVVIYPPRGVALLQRPTPAGPDADQPTPLCALVGRTRAALLVNLGLPASTTQLAQQLNVSAPAVSQHLKILTANGLTVAQRRGKLMLYS
jgi:hypothetical protein